jgi:RNA polymerase sigma-70 factor (ECF subfamily)
VVCIHIVALHSFALAADDAPAKKGPANRLSYHDGKADGKKSLAGTGEMIAFTLPADDAKIAGVRIHGSRYGLPTPPKDDFDVYFVDAANGEIVATETGRYSKFNRGPEKWVEIMFADPVEVPREFKVVLNFRAERTKGVYVSYDTSTQGQHSETGLPGSKPKPATTGGDWMIEVLLAK